MVVSYNGKQYRLHKEFRIDVTSIPNEARLPGSSMVEGMDAKVYGRHGNAMLLFVWRPNEYYGAWGKEV